MPSPKDIARRIEDLTVIDEYERSVGRNGLPFDVEKFAMNAVLPEKKWAAYHEQAMKCADFLMAGNDIADALSETLTGISDIQLRRTMPSILLSVGFPDLPIFYSQHHAREAVMQKGKSHHHGLSLQLLKKIPESMENPIMVFDAPMKRDRSGRCVSPGNGSIALLDLNDPDGYPLMTFFSPPRSRVYRDERQACCMAKSIYGKYNWAQMCRNAFEDHTVLYCDPIKFQGIKKDLLRCHGTLCPQSLESLSHNISQTKQLVNPDWRGYTPNRRLHDLSNDVQAQQHDTQISAHNHSGKTHEERSR